jgi:hypothetical protein
MHVPIVPTCSTVPFPKPSKPIQKEARAVGMVQVIAGWVHVATTSVNVAPWSMYPDQVELC